MMPIRKLSTGLAAACMAAALSLSSAALPALAAGGKDAGDAPRPGLVVDTLEHGSFDLAARRGSWVAVNFWATWCSPCLKEMPELDAFDKGRDDVVVLGLAYEEISSDDLRAFLERHPVSYPIAIVDVYAPPKDFATPRGLPATHLIAPDGRLVDSFMGPVTVAELERAMPVASADGADAGE